MGSTTTQLFMKDDYLLIVLAILVAESERKEGHSVDSVGNKP